MGKSMKHKTPITPKTPKKVPAPFIFSKAALRVNYNRLSNVGLGQVVYVPYRTFYFK
jgi:hypothetical protein